MTSTTGQPILRLVGAMQLNGAAWNLGAFARLFGRLKEEVRHTGPLTRYIGYESDCTRFFGIEVERLDEIPEGMTGWELYKDAWTIQEAGKARHGELHWRWLDQAEGRRLVGEFSARFPGEAVGDFRLFAHAYVGMLGQAYDDGVRLVEYDPAWPRQFEKTARWLREALGPEVAQRIEHYGSTAIPGMPAKPVIDVLVEVPSYDFMRRHVIPLLNRPEWEYWHGCFIGRKALMGPRVCHLHMATAGEDIWQGLIFRDYLRAHPEEAQRYAELKHQLAEQYRTDRERYTEGKGEFVREIIALAINT